MMKNNKNVLFKRSGIMLAGIIAIAFGLAACASMTLVSLEDDTVEGPKQVRQGQDIAPSSVIVYGWYKDDSRKLVNVSSVSFDKHTPGPQTVRVRAGGRETLFRTEVMPLTSLAVSSPPADTLFVVGQTQGLWQGLALQGEWEQMGSARVDLTACTITGFDSASPGIKHITVSLYGQSAGFDIEVLQLTSITIDRAPARTNYTVGQSIDLSGIQITGTYTGENPSATKTQIVPMTQLEVTGFDSSRVASGQQVTVTVNGRSANFSVNITEAAQGAATPPPQVAVTPPPPTPGEPQTPQAIDPRTETPPPEYPPPPPIADPILPGLPSPPPEQREERPFSIPAPPPPAQPANPPPQNNSSGRAVPDYANWDIAALDTAANVDYLSPAEKDVILEMNMARADPRKYAELYIRPMLQYQWGGPYGENSYLIPGETNVYMSTHEGRDGIQSCIDDLSGRQSMPPLLPAESLYLSARDHVNDMGPKGLLGHIGSDGSSIEERISRYEGWNWIRGISGIAENICYSDNTGREIVLQLLIDDGVLDRGHRNNIYRSDLRYAGAAIGIHSSDDYMCVINYASDSTSTTTINNANDSTSTNPYGR